MKMITSLFEIFDPIIRTANISTLIWILALIIPINKSLTLIPSRIKKTTYHIINYIFSELSASTNKPNKNRKVLILYSCFYIILILNLIGLIPYVYTLTSQILFTLSFALPMWGAIVLYNLRQNFNNFISHLVPLSTPIALSHFITIIESIRLIIRPITLSVRLCANITAGHILIALSRKSILILNFISLPLSILLILELAVAFIQRYVFTILLSIYVRETE